MKRRIACPVLVLAVTLSSCGDSRSPLSPMAGPSPSRTPKALLIDGCPGASSCPLDVGDEQVLVARLVYSDGSMERVAGTWTSDAPHIVEVDGEGRARGVTPGFGLVRVEAAGLRSALSFQVHPPRVGRWVGEYVVRRCDSSGSEYLTCSDHSIGSRARLLIDLRAHDGVVSGGIGFFDRDVYLDVDASSRIDDSGNLHVIARGFDGWAGATYYIDPLAARIRNGILEGTLTMKVAAQGAVIVVSTDLADMARQE